MSSTLQIGLAIAGGIVLVGVVAHNTWTTRKNTPRQAKPLPEAESEATAIEPVLRESLPASPQEPSFDMVSAPDLAQPSPLPFAADTAASGLVPASQPQSALAPAPVAPASSGTDPMDDIARSVMAQATLHAKRVPDEAEMARIAEQRAAARSQQHNPSPARASLDVMASELPQPEKRPSLDALIDVIAAIEIDQPVTGEAALAAMPATRRVGTKPFSVEGLHVDTALWETPRSGQRYSAFQSGVQLANRTGHLNEIEFSEFVAKTQAFADVLGAAPEFPDMLEEVARARELDHFASAHDAQLSFTIKATKSAWSPGYVQQNAARLGFIAGVLPGRMVVPASTQGLPPILGLTFDSQAAMSEDPTQSAIYTLALSLDVPQVDRKKEPFARMIQIAHELARVMDGVVTDDNGAPLSEAAIGAIARDLLGLYDTLDARDLCAGSPQARRLFS